MEQQTDILIVGAGVIGSASAWFASHLDASITVLERHRAGQGGATKISRGLLRVYEPQEALAPWAAQGLRFYLHWPQQQLGLSPTCHPGLLYRLKPEHISYAQTFVDTHHTEDYPIRLQTFSALKAHFPQLRWYDKDWVVYEPLGGYGDPIQTAQQFMHSAQSNCVRFYEQQTVLQFKRTENGRWRITTSDNHWIARTLILCTGAYTSDWFPELDLRTRSIAIPIFQAMQPIPFPVIDEVINTYMRPLHSNEFIVGSQQFDYGHWSDWTDQASEQQIADSHRRVQLLLPDVQPSLEQQYTLGFDGYTSNFLPILENDYQEPGLILVTGLSGRGYKMAPAIGQWVQEQLQQTYGYAKQPRRTHEGLDAHA